MKNEIKKSKSKLICGLLGFSREVNAHMNITPRNGIRILTGYGSERIKLNHPIFISDGKVANIHKLVRNRTFYLP